MSIITSTVSTRVRFFEEEDIVQVADLHQKVFPTPAASSRERRRLQVKYFSEVFLSSQNDGEAMRSLVYCDGHKLIGFLGTVSRPMSWNGERVLARISSQFIVDPGSRGFAGVELLRTFFNGPQDISIADESNRHSRRIWEALGGVTSLLHSMQWICPLRLGGLGVWALAKTGRFPAPLPRIASPLAVCLDAVASKLHANPFQARRPAVDAEELDIASLSACLAEFTPSRQLRPLYYAGLLDWLIDHAGLRLGREAVKTVVVKSTNQRILGWYIYRLGHNDISDVLQLFAIKGHESEVLAHLAFHAASQGALALRGRCEPMLAEALSKEHWPCQWGPWVLVHSRRPALTDAFQRGDVFFSRLEGEWCLRFS